MERVLETPQMGAGAGPQSSLAIQSLNKENFTPVIKMIIGN